MSKKLFLFTHSFPFGDGETFIETEVEILALSFSRIVIQPLIMAGVHQRTVPDNVVVRDPVLSENRAELLQKGLLNAAPIRYHLRDFLKQGTWRNTGNYRFAVIKLLQFRAVWASGLFQKILRNIQKKDVLYSYWGTGLVEPFTIAPWTKENPVAVRVHRGDLYLEEKPHFLPLQKEIFQRADLIAPISQHGHDYLTRKCHVPETKVELHRLGTKRKEPIMKPQLVSENDPITLASCARLVPRKRIHILAEALAGWRRSTPVEWHHFGGGPEYEKISRILKKLPETVKAHFHGDVENRQIHEFYQNNPVHLFLNTSSNEGLPVSIMEAMSYGIPCAATDCGGTSEIVTRDNGFLLPSHPGPEEIRGLLEADDSYRHPRLRENAFHTWNKHYNAETNYRRFACELQSLRRSAEK